MVDTDEPMNDDRRTNLWGVAVGAALFAVVGLGMVIAGHLVGFALIASSVAMFYIQWSGRSTRWTSARGIAIISVTAAGLIGGTVLIIISERRVAGAVMATGGAIALALAALAPRDQH